MTEHAKRAPPPPFDTPPERSGVRVTAEYPNEEWVEETTTTFLLPFVGNKFVFIDRTATESGEVNLVYESNVIRATVENRVNVEKRSAHVWAACVVTVGEEPLFLQIAASRRESEGEERYTFRYTPAIAGADELRPVLAHLDPQTADDVRTITRDTAMRMLNSLAAAIAEIRRSAIRKSIL